MFINHPPDAPLALVLSLPNGEARLGLVPDSLFRSLPGASHWGLLWWQIGCVDRTRSVRCARHTSKSEIPGRRSFILRVSKLLRVKFGGSARILKPLTCRFDAARANKKGPILSHSAPVEIRLEFAIICGSRRRCRTGRDPSPPCDRGTNGGWRPYALHRGPPAGCARHTGPHPYRS